MKKLIILIDGISNSGGTDRVASTLSGLLCEEKYDVTLYSLTPGQPYYPTSDKVNIVNPSASSRVLKLMEFCRYLKKNPQDAIMIISMGKLSVQALLLLKFFNNKTKVVCCDHVSIESFSKVIRRLKLFCYKLADEIAVLTDHDKRLLNDTHHLQNVHVVRNISPFHNNKIDITFADMMAAKSKTVIAVGRLTYQKNFSRMLDVWKEVNKQGWTLLIVGNGDEKAELEKKISDFNLQESVTIVEPSKRVDEYYRNAGLLLMTSRYEGLPMVLIEAKDFALPTIAFDCKTGPDEIITDDGYVIPYENNADFVEKVNLLIADSAKRQSLSANAWRNANQYGPERIISQWEWILG